MITYYELVELDYEGYVYVSYGKFSTYEEAEEFKNKFKGYDGFGICEESLEIQKVEFELDKPDDWVLELLESCRQRKENYDKKVEES